MDPEGLLPLTPLSFHIVLALTAGDRHGYGLMKEVRERSRGAINPATGTVYLALQRLEEAGLVGDGVFVISVTNSEVPSVPPYLFSFLAVASTDVRLFPTPTRFAVGFPTAPTS